MRRTPFASLTPDPPNVSCVVYDHLSPSGPSRYTCPRVDMPPQSLPSPPENDPVRVLDAIVEHLDISAIEATYKGGGASSFDPRMLLKGR